MVTSTNSDAKIYAHKNKVKYRVSIRYKAFVLEECLLSKKEKDAVVHFLYVLSRAMKRDGECPFYYKWEENAV